MAKARLRDKQLVLTRDLVLESLAGLIAEGHLADFSVQDVADRAGVSHRTIYRHFPTREALLHALVTWVEQKVAGRGGMDLPERIEEIVGVVQRKFDVLERFAPIVTALAKLDAATAVSSAQSVRSTAALRQALAEAVAGLDPDIAEAVVHIVHLLGSSRTWLILREEAGIGGDRSGLAAAWAVETLLEALRAGRGPAFTERRPNPKEEARWTALQP